MDFTHFTSKMATCLAVCTAGLYIVVIMCQIPFTNQVSKTHLSVNPTSYVYFHQLQCEVNIRSSPIERYLKDILLRPTSKVSTLIKKGFSLSWLKTRKIKTVLNRPFLL